MKKKVVIILTMVLFVLGGLTTFAVINYQSRQEVEEKISETSLINVDSEVVVNSIRLFLSDNSKIVYEKDGYQVYEGELELAKLNLRQRALVYDENTSVSEEEAIDYVLKRKLMIQDAESKGVILSEDKLQQSLDNIRKTKGVDENGLVTKDDELADFLEENSLTYDDYEVVIKNNLQYSLPMEEYLYALYEEELKNNPEVQFSQKIMDDRLDLLLNELKEK